MTSFTFFITFFTFIITIIIFIVSSFSICTSFIIFSFVIIFFFLYFFLDDLHSNHHLCMILSTRNYLPFSFFFLPSLSFSIIFINDSQPFLPLPSFPLPFPLSSFPLKPFPLSSYRPFSSLPLPPC